MKVTVKGQVTIPQRVRHKLGIPPGGEVDFIEEGERVYLCKRASANPSTSPFRRFRGAATVRMTTEQILALTRGLR